MNEGNLPTSAVLDLAADLIEEKGWTQGPAGWVNSTGKGLCLEGGIMAATGVFDLEALAHCPAYRAVESYLGARLEADDSLYDWNDQKDRTAEQVVATLRAAALVEAARETPANLVIFDAATLAEAEAVAELVSR